MSTIAGIFQFNKEPVSPEHARALMKSFQQYPADGIQAWMKDDIFLGCHAQWITPESVGEQLPYYDYERQLAITADAIIDNREQLFDRLQVKREHRKSMPDSRLILLAYEKWGEDAPKFLVGDFAFAIWDGKQRKLFLARDFSGARTLYYFFQTNQMAFSTTMAPLFTLPSFKKQVNEEWLAQYLAIPTMVEAVDMSATVYQSIHQVPPSHSVTIVDGRIQLKRYCTIEVKEELKLKSDEEYMEAFHDVFQKAVTSRIRTYGEVGSHLSGGLDSGSVVSFAAKALQKEGKTLHTFSYIPEDDFVDWTDNYYIPDERPFIKETVQHVGNIKDQYLSFPGKNPYSEVDNFLELMEMPYKFFENTFWLKGITEAAHKQGIKVLLNGARGNHSISWGSWKLTTDYYAALLKKLRWFQLNKELTYYTRSARTGKKHVLPIIVNNAFPAYHRLKTSTKPIEPQFPQIIHPDLVHRTKVYEKLHAHNLVPSTGAIIGRNLSEYRCNYYKELYPWNKSGVAGTNLSLRYALWDRDPTNDARVIQFCLALPEEQYVKEGMERSFLRRAMKGVLPDKVRLNQNSRGIQGADVIHRMMVQWDCFMEELEKMIHERKLEGILHYDVLKDAFSKLGAEPRPELVLTDEFKVLTRGLIVHRFIKKLKGGD